MKKLTLLVAMLAVAGMSFAASVSENQARLVAQKFMSANSTLNIKSEASLAYTFRSGSAPRVYVFNFGDSGFVMVSADDVARPIIGYSETGSFDADNIPSNLASFINSEFVAAIDNAIEYDVAQSDDIATEWSLVSTVGRINAEKAATGVNPLVSTTWNQDCYYNEQCPAATNQYACNHVYAGCVATAMAQIIRYWEYPTHGTGQHSYTHPTYGNQSVNYATQNYNYSAMPLSIGSSNPQVAKLIYHCAVSVDMDFGVDGSGASSYDAADAFKNYFDYSPELVYKEKSSYNDANWIQRLKGNLNSGIPVLYCGHGSNGGHAWVCDGYNDQNQFHMNWGWSGSGDAFFALSALNTSEGSFSSNQGAIFDVIPANLCGVPQVVNVDVFNTTVNVSWTASESEGVTYRVYRDGVQIASNISETSYVDTDVELGVHCYTIKTVCQNNIESQSTQAVCDTVSTCPTISNLSSSIIGSDVTLSWAPAIVNNVAEWLYYGDYQGQAATTIGLGSSFSTAVKFMPNQLADFAGAKITKVSIFDAEACTATIKIYQGTTTTQATLKNSRVVSLNGTNSWRGFVINDVELNVNQPLWIVVFYNSTGYVAPLMQITSETNGRLFSSDGQNWNDLANAMQGGGSYTNMIECFVTNLASKGGEKGLAGYNIYRDDVLIGTTTQTTFQDSGLTNGQMYCYRVRTLCSNGESDGSQCVCVTGGVNSIEENNNGQVEIYPNPSNGLINVRAEGMNSISVFSLTGQKLIDRVAGSDDETVDMTGFGAGVYMIRIVTENGSAVRRVVIQ